MKAEIKNIGVLKQKLISYLGMKKEFLIEILRLTEATRFKSTEEDAQIFINLVEKRENIINEIRRIDFEISSSKYRTVYENHKDEIETLNDGVKDLIIKIAKKDEIVSKKADIAFMEIKKRVKEYNDGKNINDAYHSIGVVLETGNYYEH